MMHKITWWAPDGWTCNDCVPANDGDRQWGMLGRSKVQMQGQKTGNKETSVASRTNMGTDQLTKESKRGKIWQSRWRTKKERMQYTVNVTWCDVPSWKGKEDRWKNQLEEAASHNETKIFYRIARELTGMWSYTNIPVKEKNGKRSRWTLWISQTANTIWFHRRAICSTVAAALQVGKDVIA